MFDRNENKKIRKAREKKDRIIIANFNCGTRTHKSKKDYDRKKFKKIDFEYWQLKKNMIL